jgi:hypothetical protein
MMPTCRNLTERTTIFWEKYDQTELLDAPSAAFEPRRVSKILERKTPFGHTPRGYTRYVQVLPLDTDVRDLVIGSRTGLVEPFDGIAELWVDSLKALERDWSTDKAKEFVQAFFEDEKNFIDWSRSTILVSEENIVMP